MVDGCEQLVAERTYQEVAEIQLAVKTSQLQSLVDVLQRHEQKEPSIVQGDVNTNLCRLAEIEVHHQRRVELGDGESLPAKPDETQQFCDVEVTILSKPNGTIELVCEICLSLLSRNIVLDLRNILGVLAILSRKLSKTCITT